GSADHVAPRAGGMWRATPRSLRDRESERPARPASIFRESLGRTTAAVFVLWAAGRDVDLTVMTDVTRLLDAAAAGDPAAAAELLPLVYDELRKLAAARLAAERPGQTLQPTALVHEA